MLSIYKMSPDQIGAVYPATPKNPTTLNLRPRFIGTRLILTQTVANEALNSLNREEASTKEVIPSARLLNDLPVHAVKQMLLDKLSNQPILDEFYCLPPFNQDKRIQTGECVVGYLLTLIVETEDPNNVLPHIESLAHFVVSLLQKRQLSTDFILHCLIKINICLAKNAAMPIYLQTCLGTLFARTKNICRNNFLFNFDQQPCFTHFSNWCSFLRIIILGASYMPIPNPNELFREYIKAVAAKGKQEQALWETIPVLPLLLKCLNPLSYPFTQEDCAVLPYAVTPYRRNKDTFLLQMAAVSWAARGDLFTRKQGVHGVVELINECIKLDVGLPLVEFLFDFWKIPNLGITVLNDLHFDPVPPNNPFGTFIKAIVSSQLAIYSPRPQLWESIPLQLEILTFQNPNLVILFFAGFERTASTLSAENRNNLYHVFVKSLYSLLLQRQIVLFCELLKKLNLFFPPEQLEVVSVELVRHCLSELNFSVMLRENDEIWGQFALFVESQHFPLWWPTFDHLIYTFVTNGNHLIYTPLREFLRAVSIKHPHLSMSVRTQGVLYPALRTGFAHERNPLPTMPIYMHFMNNVIPPEDGQHDLQFYRDQIRNISPNYSSWESFLHCSSQMLNSSKRAEFAAFLMLEWPVLFREFHYFMFANENGNSLQLLKIHLSNMIYQSVELNAFPNVCLQLFPYIFNGEMLRYLIKNGFFSKEWISLLPELILQKGWKEEDRQLLSDTLMQIRASIPVGARMKVNTLLN